MADNTWLTKKLELPVEVELNYLCDRRAGDTSKNNSLWFDVSIIIFPGKQWAVVSSHPMKHKVVGKLSHAISNSIYCDPLLDYIHRKHGMSEAKRDQICSEDLRSFLLSLLYHRRATTIKLIHWWMPCNYFLWRQKWTPSPLCPWCNMRDKTQEHNLACLDPLAMQARYDALQKLVEKFWALEMNPILLAALQARLHLFLGLGDIPTMLYDEHIAEATRHQNILGWRQFLCGYVSEKWEHAQQMYERQVNNTPKTTWNHIIIR